MQLTSISAVAVAIICADVTNAYTVVSNVRYTFFGNPDNGSGGTGIAHDCGRGYNAGGSGSFNNPLTMASVPGKYNKCEVVWSPYLKKYLRNEDDCATCSGTQADIWTGSGGDAGAQQACERRLTPSKSHNVIRFGSSGHSADTGRLWDGSCHPEHTYPDGN